MSVCEREHCLCQRQWRPGDFINRAEHERAAADHLTPVEATMRRLKRLWPEINWQGK